MLCPIVNRQSRSTPSRTAPVRSFRARRLQARRLQAWAGALLTLLVVLAARPAPARADVKAEVAALEKKGEAIRYSKPAKGSIDIGGASILVDAPIKKVRGMVQKYGRYKKYVPIFEQSRLIQKKSGSSDVYMEIPVMHGAATIWMVARFAPSKKAGAEEHIVGRYVKGNIDQFVARWRLRPLDAKRTLVKLELLVDPGLPLPSAYVTKGLAYAADKGVTAVRDYAEGRKRLPKSSKRKKSKTPKRKKSKIANERRPKKG